MCQQENKRDIANCAIPLLVAENRKSYRITSLLGPSYCTLRLLSLTVPALIFTGDWIMVSMLMAVEVPRRRLFCVAKP